MISRTSGNVVARQYIQIAFSLSLQRSYMFIFSIYIYYVVLFKSIQCLLEIWICKVSLSALFARGSHAMCFLPCTHPQELEAVYIETLWYYYSALACRETNHIHPYTIHLAPVKDIETPVLEFDVLCSLTDLTVGEGTT